MSKEKYCLYMEQNVICSGYNNDGNCRCLNCNEKKCKNSCKERTHPKIFEWEDETKFCMCSECINNTLYNSGNQR